MKTTEELISDLIEQRDSAERKLNELSNEMIYEGNSVGYIYSKAKNYSNCIMRCWDVLHEYGIKSDGQTDVVEAIRILGERTKH